MPLDAEQVSSFPRRGFHPQLPEEGEEIELEDSIVYGETFFTSEVKNSVVEEDTTPLGIYSAEIGEGGKKQQDSLAVFTVENENGEKETWYIIADGVSNSRDGATASTTAIQILKEKLQSGINITTAVLQIAQEFSDAVEKALAAQKAQNRGPLPIDLLDAGEINPLLATTLVAVKVNETGETTAYRLGDGQVYLSRLEKRGQIEKIQNNKMSSVDFDAEETAYNNPMERMLRNVAGDALKGGIDLVNLYKKGTIELVGRTAPLKGALDKTVWGGSVQDLDQSTQSTLAKFSESPEEQADKLKEIPLGELKPGDVFIVCSDGIENNILCKEIFKIVEFYRQKSKTNFPDTNLIRAAISGYVQKIMEGRIKKHYAKPDNFSMIIYIQTEHGIEKINLDDVKNIQPFETTTQPQ